MEDFLSNKDSSDEIIGQSLVGNIVNFAIKKISAVIDFTQGAKVAGLSACRDFVTNGEHAHSPFTKNVPNCWPYLNGLVSAHLIYQNNKILT